ncbi:MAG: glycosyltransferase [Acidimicrobiales bacterium]
MRVIHVTGALQLGGHAFAAIHAAGYLHQHGVDAVLASTVHEPGGEAFVRDIWPDLPLYAFDHHLPRHYWNAPDLRRWLRAEVPRADLVVLHGVMKVPYVDGARISRKAGVPYLIHPHGSLDPYDLRKHRASKTVYGPLVVRPMVTRSAGVVVTADRERDRLVTYGGSAPVYVLPLAVQGPAIRPDGGRFRARAGIDGATPMVLFLSRIDPKKGIERLLRAVAALRAARPTLMLVIVGTSELPGYEEGLRRLAGELGVTDAVMWVGGLVGADKWDAFAAADVLALPSDNENFGIVVLEALLAGTPSVISDEVYLSDHLGSAGGAAVCARDPASVAAAIARLLDQPETARAMVEAGRRLADEQFSPAAVTRETIRLYESVIAARHA